MFIKTLDYNLGVDNEKTSEELLLLEYMIDNIKQIISDKISSDNSFIKSTSFKELNEELASTKIKYDNLIRKVETTIIPNIVPYDMLKKAVSINYQYENNSVIITINEEDEDTE